MPPKAAVPAKRKQTEEMDTSPPKRVTRARSAKISTQSTEPTPKIETKAKTTAASSKANTAFTKKKAGPPPKARAPAKTTRKTRAKDDTAVEDEVMETVPDAKDEEKVDGGVVEQKKTRKGAAKATETESKPSVPKSKGVQPKATVRQSAKDEAVSTRSRPKRGAALDELQEATEEPEAATEIPTEVEPVKKTTRGRAGAASARATTKATAAKATGVPKKKVQFQEEHDKENIPVELKLGPNKSAMKTTGMKAKPVRKATATRATTRGKRATEQTDKETSPVKAKAMPLSPKKVDQIAKTSSGSEDELTGGKSLVRAMSMSPVKIPKSPANLPESSKNSAPDEEVVPSSPTRLITMNMNASPARRPPQSPFKDGLKCSPIKGMFSPMKRPELSTSQVLSPSKHSLLRESPKKGLAIADATYSDLKVSKAVSLNKTSLLQESPRKGRLGESFSTLKLAPSQSSLKGSLLQSPARRPPSSPFKSLAKSSPIKSKTGEADIQASHAPTDLTLIDNTDTGTPHIDNLSSEARETSIEEPGVSLYQAESEAPLSPALASSPEEPQTYDDLDLFAPCNQEQQQDIINPESPPVVEGDNRAELKEVQNPTSIGDDDPMDTSEDAISSHDKTEAAPLPMSSMSWRRISGLSQLSEDELASPDKKYAPTPLRKTQTGTPHASDTPDLLQNDVSFGCLVDGMSSWTASSPDKKRPSRQQRGIFSLADGHVATVPEPTDAGGLDTDTVSNEAVKQSFFEEDPVVINAEKAFSMAEAEAEESYDTDLMKASMESQASQEYGDENVVPEEAELLRTEQDATEVLITCTPAKLVNGPREVCTVSKVPLRPSSEDSPLKIPRKRSKSLGGALAVLTESPDDDHIVPEQPATPQLASTIPPQTPSSGLKLASETPRRSRRRSSGVSKVLKGAIVYVDVHTTEGADASGIFVDLLTQMGARCVKQWTWQPGADLNDSLNGSTSPSGSPVGGTVSAGKVGITHVVYKDGGKRTLEKIRMANGVVMCVGVGWVLE